MLAAGNRQAGFTLLEALVVVAIVGMLSAIIAPNMSASLDILSLRESAGVLQADLRTARATALRTGSRVIVAPLPDGRGYDWVGGTRRFPAGTAVRMSGQLTFMPDGSILPADISLSSGGRRMQVSMDTITGAIKVGAG